MSEPGAAGVGPGGNSGPGSGKAGDSAGGAARARVPAGRGACGPSGRGSQAGGRGAAKGPCEARVARRSPGGGHSSLERGWQLRRGLGT